MQISDEVRFLEETFDVLNEQYFESALQKIAITIQSTPRAYGHFTPWDSWDDNGEKIKEINIGAESLDRPMANIVATLLHEMVHYYCHVNGIKDTSRSNTYHNKRFKEETEKRGLIIQYARGIGHSVTQPAQELVELIILQGWENRLKLYRERGFERSIAPGFDDDDAFAVKPGKKKSSTRKYVCPCCGMSIRATKIVRIACMECNDTQMEEAG